MQGLEMGVTPCTCESYLVRDTTSTYGVVYDFFMRFYAFVVSFDVFIRHLMYMYIHVHVYIISNVVLCCILFILVFYNKELFENQLEIRD